MKVTLISDTHNKHSLIPKDSLKGDIIIHSGDFSSLGHRHECKDFLKWYNSLDYKYKVFICGNHEVGVQKDPHMLTTLLIQYPDLIYLNEESVNIEGLNIYGSPWTPFFFNWAYNAQRGEEIKKHWDKIPNNTDILVTHGPVYGINDTVLGRPENLGCKDLYDKILEIKPLIHTCGHIHTGNGYKEFNDINFFNTSVLDESYQMRYKPYHIEIEWEDGKPFINDITNG